MSEPKKPIIEINKNIEHTNKLLNSIVVRMSVIESDLKQVKEILKEENKIEEINKGWFFSSWKLLYIYLY